MANQLHLSRRDKKLAGVCGGLAQYLEVDSTLIRIIWVALTLLGGSGLLLYIIAWILMPSAPGYEEYDE